ncbi:class I SAM-dependent methyltransferase [bacterium]|jgi:methyltransferase-like protein/SAM-dependent methyltransferase|nr:class I SAM-dependent methyltransferase [bacterium]
MTTTFAYDLVTYESFPYPQTRPDRIATIGRLFGIDAAPPENCRVLELGCASGGNLIPLAEAYPESRFLGIDLSKRQVAEGVDLINRLDLQNIEIKHLDITEANKETGKFDYIICHGVYSWVSPEVQASILDTCKQLLAPNGLAYISYNTYPGWHFRGMIRDMMLYHTANLADPAMKVAQARALLDFLVQSVPAQDNAYGIMLKNEATLLKQLNDTYLLHEHLSEANQPVYFHQFAEKLPEHGLQYVGEADFHTMISGNLPKEVDETLKRISNEIVRTEQYMDFVRNRTFRQTVVCRSDLNINRNLSGQNVVSFNISGSLQMSSDISLEPGKLETFSSASGTSLTTGQPLTKAALRHLAQIYPASISFKELLSVATAAVAPLLIQDADSALAVSQQLGSDILTCYASNIINLKSSSDNFTTTVSDKPAVAGLAREQAKTLNRVTNRLHEIVNIDSFGRTIIGLLDGESDYQSILNKLAVLASTGQLVVQKDGRALTSADDLKSVLDPTLRETLNRFASAALLLA